jgi:glycosyltransferase involved in cell wall biosynthesis
VHSLPARPRSIHTEHNLWSSYRRATYLANAFTYPRNRLVLAVSDSVAASIRRPSSMVWARYPPVRTVANAVDVAGPIVTPAIRAAARKSLGIENDRLVVGCVASLTPEKDHAGLLRALSAVREDHPDVLLLLIGSGPLEHDVRDTVARLGLTDHVRLLGARMDVPDLLPALDVFALSSHYEGLPVSILEAMAAGLPTVASAVGGVPEAITDGVEGWLVQRGDPKQFADRLGRLLCDPESRRRMGAHARQRVEDRYSINRLVNDIESAYTDALLPTPGR